MKTEDEKRLRRKEYLKKYRSKNYERLKVLQKKYRSTPEAKEKHRIKMLEWRKNNPEKAIEISRKNYKVNGKKNNERRKQKEKENFELILKRRERHKKYNESGKRKIAFDKNPNKKEILKRKWIKIKSGDYENYRIKCRKYREQTQKKKEQLFRDELNDKYVINVIKKQFNYKIKTKEIPKELIELKRNTLKLKRITKTK